MSAPGPACTLGTNKSLVRAGIEGGFPKLRFDGERLLVSGTGGTEIVVAAGDVSRLRLARFEPTARTRGFCEAKIWPPGEPLYFSAMIDDKDFAAVIGGFARRVAAAHGIGALRRGPDLATAVLMALLTIGSLTLLLAFLLYVAIADGGWWWVPLAVFLPLYALAWRAQLSQHWPRRVRDLDELGSLLPR